MRDMVTMDKRHPARAAFAGLLCALALAGCEREEREPEPEPTQTAEPQGSIFRDDLEGSVLPEPELAPLRTSLSFAGGGTELGERASAELASVIASPQVEEGWTITLRTHADAGEMEETEEGDTTPSQARAEAIREFLVANGVAEEKVAIIDFGAQNPLQPNALPDGTPNDGGRAVNRRVDIEVAEAKIAPEETEAERKSLAEDVAEGE